MVALTHDEWALIDLLRRCRVERRALNHLGPGAREAAVDLVRDGLARWTRQDDGEYLSLSETDERTT